MKEKEPSMSLQQVTSYIDKQIDNYYRLYILNLYLLTEAANYVNEAAQIHASKLVRQNNGTDFSVRIYHNPIVQGLVLNQTFQDVLKKEKFHLMVDQDLFRQVYQKLSALPAYAHYTSIENSTLNDDYKILVKVYNEFIANNEVTEHAIEDIIPNWHDDKPGIMQWVSATLKDFSQSSDRNLPAPSQLKEEKLFAKHLVEGYLYHEEEFRELIKPKLKNWEEDRIAEVDMILIKMGLTEFLYLKEIPVKVTINEYLEISKNYSTPQSKDFINGILDGLLKDLKAANKLQKAGRGALES